MTIVYSSVRACFDATYLTRSVESVDFRRWLRSVPAARSPVCLETFGETQRSDRTHRAPSMLYDFTTSVLVNMKYAAKLPPCLLEEMFNLWIRAKFYNRGKKGQRIPNAIQADATDWWNDVCATPTITTIWLFMNTAKHNSFAPTGRKTNL